MLLGSVWEVGCADETPIGIAATAHDQHAGKLGARLGRPSTWPPLDLAAPRLGRPVQSCTCG